jgi:hypothetical protein
MVRGDSLRRGCWLCALLAACVATGLAGIGRQLSPPGANTAAPGAGGVGPPTSVALVSAVSLAAAQQDYATLTPVTMSVTAGVATQFTFTFTAAMTFKGGIVSLQVPTGWPDPTTGPPGSQGVSSVASSNPTQPVPTFTFNGATISISNVDLGPGQTITVSYSAAAPQPASPPSEVFSFAATAQQFAHSVMQSLASQVTVMSPVSASISPVSASTSPVSASASPVSASASPVSASASPLSAHKGAGGSGSDVAVPLVLGLAAAIAAVALLARRLVRRRVVPVTAQSVQAVSHAGPPAQLTVHKTGTEPTRTVRIEPHPDAGTTTIQELDP